jgi:hypothetical protein
MRLLILNAAMNTTYRPPEVPPPGPKDLRQDSLYALTGLMWGSLIGGAFWLMVFVMVITS